jgi:hypothetical protein
MARAAVKKCQQEELHYPDQPDRYRQWHAWAEQMSKTHIQSRCPSCGLFKVWTRLDQPQVSDSPSPSDEGRS